MIAYGWIREYFTLHEAANLLSEQFLESGLGIQQSKAERLETIAKGFASLLIHIYEFEQVQQGV